jgi:hypothetical protein
VVRPQVAIAGVMQKVVDGKLVDNDTVKFCIDAIGDLLSEIRWLPPLDPNDPTAKALGYVNDSAKPVRNAPTAYCSQVRQPTIVAAAAFLPARVPLRVDGAPAGRRNLDLVHMSLRSKS